MKYPNNITFSGQKVSVCNRYIEQYRQEHNNHLLGTTAKARRAELDALMPDAYHDQRLVWLAIKWKDVLTGQLNPDYPLKSAIEYLIRPIPEEDRAILTAKKDDAYQAYRAFAKWQREEHDVTVQMLMHERHKAMEECKQDITHNPTLSDFSANGKRKLNVPSSDEAINTAFAMRAFVTIPDMDKGHREAVFEAIAEAKQASYTSTLWDNKIDKELVRTNISMPEPPDPIEDFTTYTEVDPVGDITVTSDTVTFDTMARNIDAYVYKDKDVDHFEDFGHIFDTELTASEQSGWVNIWTLANVVNNFKGIIDASEDALAMFFFQTAGPVYTFYLWEVDAGTNYNDSVVVNIATPYYISSSRVGTALTGKVHSDVDRITLVGIAALTLQNAVKFRYVYACQSYNTGNVWTSSGYTKNLDLQEVIGNPNYYYAQLQ